MAGKIRKTLLFIVMAAMLGGGAYIIELQVHSTHRLYFRGLAVGGFLVAFGLYVLVDDFIRPAARRLKG
ncbi:MAG: hypothetical protein PW843_10590 [Azospirillaceae bacterium]|nr:hypothetical protein [Azospirillaceae bacterium]